MTSREEDAAARHLAAIVESSDDAIISKDLDGRILSWNPAASRIFGYGAAEAIGQSILLIVPRERWPEEAAVLARIRAGETIDHFETVRRRKDGALVPVSLSVSPIRDDAGRVIGASKISRDISERKRAQWALGAAESARADLQRRLLTLVAASRSLVGTPDVHAVVSATLRLADQLVAADAYAVWRLDPHTSAWAPMLALGVSREFLDVTAAASLAKGQPLSFTEPQVVTDISVDDRFAHRREAYAREGVRALLVIPMSVLDQWAGTLALYYRQPHEFSEVDVETARALGNLAAAALTTAELYEQQLRAEFLADAAARLAGSLDYEQTLMAVAQLVVPRFADACVVDLVNESGEWQRVAEVTGPSGPPHGPSLRVPLVTHDGVIGAVTFAHARPTAEFTEDERRFAGDLAARAAMAIENARAYDQVRRANQVKDDFLATLSHELRTPLNAILGYARMLRTDAVPPDRQEHALVVIERNATALTQIVGDVLDVSRIVAGKLRLALRDLDLRDVVHDAADTVSHDAEVRGVRLILPEDPPPLPIRGDAARLQQVIWNLLSNAIKFTPGGGEVRVALERGEHQVVVGVRDTGVGIAAAFLPHIFEPFRQADSKPSREFGGLGLGLAIVRRIVEMHGGTVDVVSGGMGRGSEFRVTLPSAQP